MWAAAKGQVEVVRELLKAGADVLAQSNLDGTALRWAAKHGHEETVRVLLNAGADPQAPCVLEYAEYNGHEMVVQMLKAALANQGAA